jgi:hypothetical protein
MKINNSTTLTELLEYFPHLDLTLAGVLPAVGDLQQPALREQVFNVVNIEHIAIKAGWEVSDLILELKRAAGIEVDKSTSGYSKEFLPQDPDWIKTPPRITIDGVEMLSEGEHPLGFIQEKLKELSSGDVILLLTNFHPGPMLEVMRAQGQQVFSREDAENLNQQLTFIQK